MSHDDDDVSERVRHESQAEIAALHEVHAAAMKCYDALVAAGRDRTEAALAAIFVLLQEAADFTRLAEAAFTEATAAKTEGATT